MSDLGDEINHLAEFGWAPKRIADRLTCSVSAVEKHLARERLRSLAAEESAVVYSRRTTERGSW